LPRAPAKDVTDDLNRGVTRTGDQHGARLRDAPVAS
jgi:hypothetical protein